MNPFAERQEAHKATAAASHKPGNLDGGVYKAALPENPALTDAQSAKNDEHVNDIPREEEVATSDLGPIFKLNLEL